MILLDSRYSDHPARPRDFLSWFGGLAVPVHLDYGDAVFWDATGARSLCLEVKSPRDALICMRQTGRLAQQIRSALAAGHAAYALIVQGYAMTEDGFVGRPTRGGIEPVRLPSQDGEGERVPYRDFDNFLTTMAWVNGILVKRTRDEQETAKTIVDLYWWWQKDLGEHGSLDRFYTPVYLPGLHHSLVRRVAKELRGIGSGKSKAVEKRFKSVYEMATAGEQEWQEIPGIGKGIAQGVMKELRGE